jgi:hypothetical protein
MARLDPVAAQVPDAEGRPSGPLDAAARWRYELERAQWQLRGSRAVSGAEPGARAGSQAQAAAAPSKVSAQQPPMRESQAQRSLEGKPVEQTSKSIPSEAGLLPARAGGKPAGYAIEPAQAHKEGGARMPAPLERALRPLRVIWPRVNVHAALQDGEAQVWVRDASIGPHNMRRLAAEVAARLRAAGLRPGRLYLNGEEIPHFEGGASWR